MHLMHFSALMGLGVGEILTIAVVIALVMGLTVLVLWAATIRTRSGLPARGPERAQKKCPDCAELILAEARVCKHCSYRFEAKR